MKVDFIAGALPYAEQLGWKVLLLAPGSKLPLLLQGEGRQRRARRHVRPGSDPRLGQGLPGRQHRHRLRRGERHRGDRRRSAQRRRRVDPGACRQGPSVPEGAAPAHRQRRLPPRLPPPARHQRTARAARPRHRCADRPAATSSLRHRGSGHRRTGRADRTRGRFRRSMCRRRACRSGWRRC